MFIFRQASATVFLLALFVGFTCHAEPVITKGNLLIATPKLDGTSFEHTVILLLEYAKDGAMGIALNRPTDVTAKQLFPGVELSVTVNLGGPVHPRSTFILHGQAYPENIDSIDIVDRVFLSVDTRLLKLPRNNASNPIKIYQGYAGWHGGQLEGELARGDWVIAEGKAELIFQENNEQLWQQLYSRWRGQWL